MPISWSPTIPPATGAPSGTIKEVTSTPASPEVTTNLTMTDTPEQAVSSAISQKASTAAQVHMIL